MGGAVLAHELGVALAYRIAETTPQKLTPHVFGLLARAATRARELAPDVNLWRAQEAFIRTAERLRATRPESVELEALGAALGVRLPMPGIESR